MDVCTVQRLQYISRHEMYIQVSVQYISRFKHDMYSTENYSFMLIQIMLTAPQLLYLIQ